MNVGCAYISRIRIQTCFSMFTACIVGFPTNETKKNGNALDVTARVKIRSNALFRMARFTRITYSRSTRMSNASRIINFSEVGAAQSPHIFPRKKPRDSILTENPGIPSPALRPTPHTTGLGNRLNEQEIPHN